MQPLHGARSVAALAALLCAGLFTGGCYAQVIEFESGGLKYKALSRDGITVMFAPLPAHIHDYVVLQVSISNGSKIAWAVKPEDFRFERSDGQLIPASSAESVIHILSERGSHGDVVKLMATYEAGVYGLPAHSTNGYESRRLNSMADGGGNKIRAAAAASAIALVTTKLLPGQSTDGAVFYPTQGKPLGAGKLIVTTAGEHFEFPVESPKNELGK